MRLISNTYVRTYSILRPPATATPRSQLLHGLHSWLGRGIPAVYSVFAQDVALYIGSSGDIARRLSEFGKNQPERRTALAEADAIEIYPCESAAQAIHLEYALIQIYKPVFNHKTHYNDSYRTLPQLRIEHEKLFGEAW